VIDIVEKPVDACPRELLVDAVLNSKFDLIIFRSEIWKDFAIE
jgi:hypothetical protein